MQRQRVKSILVTSFLLSQSCKKQIIIKFVTIFIFISREQIEEQNTELERLKRSLYAKEEVERSQIEAVHTLTAKTKKQEKEILTLKEKLDNVVHKMEAYKKSLDAAKV